MKVDTQKTFVNLNGEAFQEGGKPATIGIFIANYLATPREGGLPGIEPAKAYVFIQKFYNEDEVELDEVERKALYSLFEKAKEVSPLFIGQLLEVLEKEKEDKK